MDKRVVDETGNRHGRLVVIARAWTKGRWTTWECLCDCGETIEVRGHRLRNGHTKSCGCLRREQRTAFGESRSTHGHSFVGGKETPTYSSWHSMKQRCLNPKATKWKHYGARGVRVCERWRISFENFLADMGERPAGKTLDRIDPDGNYEPGNCRWATMVQQRHNRRTGDEEG